MPTINITPHFTTFNSLSLSTSQYNIKSVKGTDPDESKLSIVKYENNSKPPFKHDEYWSHYCRGLIIDVDADKILCVPTPKGIGNNHFKDMLYDLRTKGDVNISVEPLLDGTMINLFNHNDKWTLSTRSIIGAECRWASQKTFKTMFHEILGMDILAFYEQFSKDTSYTFLMRHEDNRIVSKISENALYLVDAHKIDSENHSVHKVDYRKSFGEGGAGFECIPQLYGSVASGDEAIDEVHEKIMHEVGEYLSTNDKYFSQGVCVRLNEYRFNYKSPEYDRVKSLKGNSANPLFIYVDQRYKGLLPEYLKYFPEKLKDYSHYRDKVHIMTQELYDFYCSTFKQKTTSLKTDVPYQLKPLCYELHGLYLQNKKPVHFKMVQEFVNTMVPARLYFVLKFYFTYKKPEEKNTHIHFNELEEGEILEEP